MSDETPGAGHGALPPRDGISPRTLIERPAVRITQVAGGQYVLSSPAHAVPALAQISGGDTNASPQTGITRIISISPSRSQLETSPLRPSLTNQSIVDALTKSRTSGNIHLQLFPNNSEVNTTSLTVRSPLKRSLPPTPEKKDSRAAKLQRIINHRNVRSKIVKEKYNEHLLENFYLDVSGNILDLYQFAKRPKTQQFLQYLKENAIDPKEHAEESKTANTNTTASVLPTAPPSTPTATLVSSLPGSSSHSSCIAVSTPIVTTTQIAASDVITPASTSTPTTKTPSVNKLKTIVSGNNQEQIVEKAKQEAYVVQRISDLQKEGLWSEKRLPKVQEMQRTKAHWDFLLEEMVWLAADFAQERKWKKASAKKCARMVQKYFQEKALAAQKAEKAQEQHLKRIAAFCAKEIKNFWSNVEKLVEYKQNTRLEEKRKKALDQHLSFIVDQTEKYSQLLAEGMNKPLHDTNVPASKESSRSPSRANSDDEFQPDSQNSSDDEETIAQEEAIDDSGHSDEVAALQKESEMDFEAFLNELPKDYLQNRDKINISESEHSDEDESDRPLITMVSNKSKNKKDKDFTVESSSEEDVEDTIEEQEEVEGKQNHQDEIDDLNAENEMSIEELRQKYSGLASVPNDDTISTSGTSDSEDESKNGTSDEEVASEGDNYLSDGYSSQDDGIGLKSLIDDSHNEGENTKTDKNNDLINDAAAIAESIQPKGNTLSSTSVVTPVPFLLKLPLREYQHIGLDWLVTMYERKLNGILADEMGLGKTIQTIALLAHLACEKENWGPHLIIVPTSVMLNWEMECKKWCPGFKILTYYGTQKERKLKRTGWTKPNAFHVCITSYKLVIQDHQSFRRKKWKYLILDEAQNIKNFKSQRWQLLLNFQTQQRLLLTGTPLQNNLMELWSLMHFLMPHVFQSHREFKEWFSNPVTGMIEGNSEYNESIIKRLHKVLRPFLLRRLKSEVEKQMPKKFEHIIMCRLSKRQRYLYDDYMCRAKTRETLASGNLLSVINVLMQLRKVCNHPNLFEVRPTISSFQSDGIAMFVPSIVYSALNYDPMKHVDLYSINLNLLQLEYHLGAFQCYRMREYQTPRKVILDYKITKDPLPRCPPTRLIMRVHRGQGIQEIKAEAKEKSVKIKGGVLPPPPPYTSAQQTVVKAIPLLNVTQSGSSGQVVNVTSVLKHDNKLSPSFAQLVHTSTGKHILLTATPSSTNIPVSTTAGHKITLLSKQPVAAVSNVGQQITTKAYVKFQLTSATTPTTVTTSAASAAKVDEKEDGKKTVGAKFIEKLYGSQPSNSLDVRWSKDSNSDESNEISMESRLQLMARINDRRCAATPMYGNDFHEVVKIVLPNKLSTWSAGRNHCINTLYDNFAEETTDCLKDMLYTPVERIDLLKDVFDRFIVYVPPVRAPEPDIRVLHPSPSVYYQMQHEKEEIAQILSPCSTPLHHIASAMVTQFPDPRLIQYDCGKLQTLDKLLRKLKSESHRVLIFTQMTKMLDVLEAFLNFHGHIYLRLDGSTKVDQRQVLMERFNGDTRIFAFILSTRSGGIGVNLTGADTVIFYDSDWNPTMDAQAQDRCHRIGQTRDVHIYRLVSERTIEENILKKANQKRLLGDLAIEGGNFTTAYFKSSTIQDLFNIDATEESAANRMSEVLECAKERENLATGDAVGEDKTAIGALENALAACEDDQDVQAARIAKAEAVADLAEFDENIPLDEQEKEKEPEISKAEQEVENLIKQLTPVERYAMKFIEETEAAWSAEQLAAAEREIEEQKREWEENRLAAMREEELRRVREMEEDNEMLTFSREDATNQVWLSENTMEQMPMWCPPTPPQQDTDIYVDHTMAFLYDTKVMSEAQLPPVYVKKEAKRSRHEANLIDSRRALKIPRKDESMYAPRSLFERPSPALIKMRRDMKLQKFRGIVRPPVPIPSMKMAVSKPTVDPPCWHNWTIHEDMALLKVIQTFQGLPLNLMVISPGHTPNWDFVADYVNTVSITYRSPKQCRHRYETVLIPREEGKQIFDSSQRKKKNRSSSLHKYPTQQKTSRPMRTLQLYMQDNNSNFSQILIQRYDSLKQISNKKITLTKTVLSNPMLRNPKHSAVLNESGIDLDRPVLPVEVAARRAERIAKEKKPLTPEQQLAVAQRLQFIKSAAGQVQTSVQSTAAQATPSPSTVSVASPSISQTVVVTHSSNVTSTAASSVVTTPSTPPNALRQQRIITSPLQPPTVVSVSGLSPAQLQAATQRLIVAGTAGQAKAIVGGPGKAISQAQLQILRQAANLKQQQQLRLQAGGIPGQAVKTTTVTIAGQTAVQVQYTQAQPRTQFIRQGTVTVSGKQGITRTVTESEMQQILKKQHQQQKVIAAAVASGTQVTTIQSLSNQVFAQAIQQAGTSGTQVATLVKAVSSSGVTQTVTIPVTGVTIGTPIKALAPSLKTTTPQQLRQLQIQQQLLAQKKLVNQKIAGIAQVSGKGGVATQLIVGSKPLSTAMTMQQFQQVIRSPLGVSQGPVVLTKGTSRVIPVNTTQGAKQTIQVVAATSQGLTTTVRPPMSSALAGALTTNIKLQSSASSQSQQALLSQVSAALQNQAVGVRQNSPIRIQTASGTPLVAVTVHSAQNIQQQQQGASPQSSSTDRNEQA